MTTKSWVFLAISFVTDFVVTAGTAISTGMAGAGSSQLPGKGILITAGVAGLVMASRNLKSALQEVPK